MYLNLEFFGLHFGSGEWFVFFLIIFLDVTSNLFGLEMWKAGVVYFSFCFGEIVWILVVNYQNIVVV